MGTLDSVEYIGTARIPTRPMEYPRPYILKPGDQIVIDDLTTFFVTYMKNDNMASKERGADGLLSAIYTKHADKIDVGDLTTFFVTHMNTDTLNGVSASIQYCVDAGRWR